MFPATPTPLPAPAGPPPVIVNAAQWRIWTFVDEAIMLWQEGNRYFLGTVIQIAIILIIVIFFVVYVKRQGQKLTNDGEL